MITVRIATEEDIFLISHLGEQAFYPTYLPFISREQVDFMYRMMYTPDSLRRQMTQAGTTFLLAYSDTDAVGYASFETNVHTGTAKLHKLYVLPDIQVSGVGKSLIRTVEQYALTAGQQNILLNVNRYNKAIGFYKHLGYTILAEKDIDIGNGYFMNDYEMMKQLQ